MPVRQIARLEALPTEILSMILSAAAESPKDLASVICASSTIYRCFQSFKVAILTGPALRELGPGILDAVAISRIPTLPEDPAHAQTHGQLHGQVVEDYIRQYRKSASPGTKESEQDSLQWVVRDITPKMAESILRLNMAVQFFVDLYIATRLSYLQNQISWLTEQIDRLSSEASKPPSGSDVRDQAPVPDPETDPATLAARRATYQDLHLAMRLGKPADPKAILSPLERQRLATAFLRAQLLVTLSSPNVTQTNLRSVRLQSSFWNQPIREQVPQPTPQPSSPNSQNHRQLIDIFPAWELEQVSQAHYFMYLLCERVVSVEATWMLVWGGATGPWLTDIRTARQAAQRVRHARLVLECQFDLVAFRRRLLRGGAEVCLARCLRGSAFDSVRCAAPSCEGLGETASETKGKGRPPHYHTNPIQPEPRRINLRPTRLRTEVQTPLCEYPVSGEFHRRDGPGELFANSGIPKVRGLEAAENELHVGNDIVLPTFGPGPGSPGNVHQVEGHMALRLLLSRGVGTSNGTCMATATTNCPWLSASHRSFQTGDENYGWPGPERPEASPLLENHDDDKTKGTWSSSPPYAWTDSLDGMLWDRWGLDFLPVEPLAVPYDVIVSNHRFAHWRWFGLVFWDEERVRAIKAAVGDYETGWLSTVWDQTRPPKIWWPPGSISW